MYGRTAGNPVVNVRHESRHRLVADGIGSNFRGSLIERVDKADVAVAAEAKCVRNIFLDQIVNDDLAAVHPSQSITPLGPKPSRKGPAVRNHDQKKQRKRECHQEVSGAPTSFLAPRRAGEDEEGGISKLGRRPW